MSKAANYEECVTALENLRDFDNGRNFSAFWTTTYHGEDRTPSQTYFIYSYRTVIATVRDGIAVIDTTKYSTTTSKQQTYVRKALGHLVPRNLLTTDEQREVFDRLVKDGTFERDAFDLALALAV